MMNQLLLVNQEMNRKGIEISNMRSQSDQIRNELIYNKELPERMYKTLVKL